MKNIFDVSEIEKYTKWTQLFKYNELEYISSYGFSFVEDDDVCVDGLCEMVRLDGHIKILFNLKTGGVGYTKSGIELSFSDTNIIYSIQKQIIDKEVKRHELGIA